MEVQRYALVAILVYWAMEVRHMVGTGPIYIHGSTLQMARVGGQALVEQLTVHTILQAD